jgi:glycine/D-amino acid oxidase-like deaminating enzyme
VGIAGASVAYHLARRGVAVVIIEGVAAGPATGAGAGIICPWTGPVKDPACRLGADGLPLLGALTDGLVIAAGNGPEGLTAGPWTGRAAAALALGERLPADLRALSMAASYPCRACITGTGGLYPEFTFTDVSLCSGPG